MHQPLVAQPNESNTSHPVAHGCLMARHPKVSPAVLDRLPIVGIHRMLRVIKDISFFLPSVPPRFRRDL